MKAKHHIFTGSLPFNVTTNIRYRGNYSLKELKVDSQEMEISGCKISSLCIIATIEYLTKLI